MNGLLKSRKFWLAVFAVAQTVILYYVNVPKEIWTAIDALVITVIVGITVEDSALKISKK